MTDVSNQRRIASELLKCGVGRIWVNEAKLDEVALALTRDDVRKLIADGDIRHKQKIGISRGRARFRHIQRFRNQQRGPGKHQGKKLSRQKLGRGMRLWINRIRPQRRYLRTLRDIGEISATTYRRLYKQAKGGQFRSVSYLRTQLVENGVLKTKSPSRARGR